VLHTPDEAYTSDRKTMGKWLSWVMLSTQQSSCFASLLNRTVTAKTKWLPETVDLDLGEAAAFDGLRGGPEAYDYNLQKLHFSSI
jgi:hypothetical protein